MRSLFLFQGAFDEDNPCENLIGSSDDAFVPGGNIFDPALALELAITAKHELYFGIDQLVDHSVW